MLKSLTNVLVNEDGATLVEYGMLVALVAVVSLTAVKLLGTEVVAAFTKINTAIK
jgi:pilus assembly protein Flp/PilA